MKKLMVFVMLMFLPLVAWAQDIPISDFLTQAIAAFASFGGLGWAAKVAAVLTLVIASMKVSILNQWVWSKLGALQPWLAPLLGALYGVFSLASGGTLTLAGVLAYFAAGAGAVVLHELLDSLKSLSGLGATWVAIIDAIEAALGGPGGNVVALQSLKASRKRA